MKFRHLFLTLVAFSTMATAAFAGNINLQLNGSEKYLPECGGTVQATLTRSRQVAINLRNVKHCSNFIINNSQDKYKIPGPDGDRTGSFTLPNDAFNEGYNVIRMVVRSNTGKKSDNVTIRLIVESPYDSRLIVRVNGPAVRLPSCGGTIRATQSPWLVGPVRIQLSDVEHCSNFILDLVGRDREYKLQGDNNDRGGNYTLPDSAIDFGTNVIPMIVRSNTGKHYDEVVIKFFSL